jgi:hypothetical protein
MSAVGNSGRRVVKEENRDKADGRLWYIKGIAKDKFAGLAMQDNVANANGIDGNTTQSLDGMRMNRAKRKKVRGTRRNVTSSATVKNERQVVCRRRRSRRKGSRGRERRIVITNGQTGTIRKIERV